ncbi:class III lanthionine synthetase LanKC [Amycolatopsis sp. NPDC098790]|uniref:class III lanthionine synthetase LanKC n=1 Tax=Amycolatopsis sp. NPDC098790 TaxID=3363939 RepID=UPI0037F727C9
MDTRYDSFCAADPDFYDTPRRIPAERLRLNTGVGFGIADRRPPQGWRQTESGDWVVLGPAGARLPHQGWKVHVSARMDNADAVLDKVWAYCTARDLPFKYLAGPAVLLMRNMKYAGRGSSGKLVTIYPRDETRFKDVLHELDERLRGEEGPYILSDLRWRQGPLYVRYGGFAERYRTALDGTRELAIETPSGELVADHRGASFRVPEWVSVPEFLAEALAQRNAVTFDGLPYRPEKALHFSNGGGVYLATDTRTGSKVVLKEARPHAGLAPDGRDAVARLRNERDVIERLTGIPGIPALLDYFVLADHHFLVEEFVDGEPLSTAFKRRNPLLRNSADHAEAAEFTGWAVRVCGRVEDLAAAVHARGVVLCDLHPFNIMIDHDDVSLIDFEIAQLADAARRPSLGNPGFSPRRPLHGTEVDRYSLACLRLSLFLPITPLLHQDVTKAVEFAEEIRRRFPTPKGFVEDAVDTIVGPERATGSAKRKPTPRWEASRESWPELRRSLTAAITASATPGRDDRLFPGDIALFGEPAGKLSLAHGAAGVLYAVAATGGTPHPDHLQWLVEEAERADPRSSLGFYDGLHGVAYLLEQFGATDTATKVLDRCLATATGDLSWNLLSGRAGVGLHCAHIAAETGDSGVKDAALNAAQAVADWIDHDDLTPPKTSGPRPVTGLMRGAAGPALLFIRMFEHTGDHAYLDLAAKCIDRDLKQNITYADGGVILRNGQRTRMYLAEGITGIGFVLRRYLRHRHHEIMALALELVERTVAGPYHSHSGLFTGRAGVIALLGQRGGDTPPAGDVLRRQIRLLGWHALDFRGEIAFAGDYLYRMSMDLATGNAGILLALGSAWHDQPVSLPLLAPATPW